MQGKNWFVKIDLILTVVSMLLILISIIVLHSTAPQIFPQYFYFIILALIFFLLFLQVDFQILRAFSFHLYIISIFLLILPLIIGQVTRGAIRWIPIAGLTIQPSEIVRPFLLLFFASYLISEDMSLIKLIKSIILLIIPITLIIIQPSLGVSILTLIGFLGIFLASSIEKKYFLFFGIILILFIPLFWQILAPYQKQRLSAFINPRVDPLGAGYNSIQSMISVGSGRIFGRGLGKGAQTQLEFLPEKHTDFIFAAVSEELGFVGSIILLLILSIFLFRIVKISEDSKGPIERAFISGIFFALFAETFIHIGMNLGLLPITGIPLPLVSAGGSSLLATAISLAMVMNCKKVG